jgi:hypothetical protein
MFCYTNYISRQSQNTVVGSHTLTNLVEIRGKDMPIALIIQLTMTNFCYSKRYLSRLNALNVQNKLEVLCKYLMEDIVWSGSYSDCKVLMVTLNVGIGHRLSIGLGYHI